MKSEISVNFLHAGYSGCTYSFVCLVFGLSDEVDSTLFDFVGLGQNIGLEI